MADMCLAHRRSQVAWYTRGGFTDEYGVFHKSGHAFDIPYWEVQE